MSMRQCSRILTSILRWEFMGEWVPLQVLLQAMRNHSPQNLVVETLSHSVNREGRLRYRMRVHASQLEASMADQAETTPTQPRSQAPMPPPMQQQQPQQPAAAAAAAQPLLRRREREPLFVQTQMVETFSGANPEHQRLLESFLLQHARHPGQSRHVRQQAPQQPQQPDMRQVLHAQQHVQQQQQQLHQPQAAHRQPCSATVDDHALPLFGKASHSSRHSIQCSSNMMEYRMHSLFVFEAGMQFCIPIDSMQFLIPMTMQVHSLFVLFKLSDSMQFLIPMETQVLSLFVLFRLSMHLLIPMELQRAQSDRCRVSMHFIIDSLGVTNPFSDGLLSSSNSRCRVISSSQACQETQHIIKHIRKPSDLLPRRSSKASVLGQHRRPRRLLSAPLPKSAVVGQLRQTPVAAHRIAAAAKKTQAQEARVILHLLHLPACVQRDHAAQPDAVPLEEAVPPEDAQPDHRAIDALEHQVGQLSTKDRERLLERLQML